MLLGEMSVCGANLLLLHTPLSSSAESFYLRWAFALWFGNRFDQKRAPPCTLFGTTCFPESSIYSEKRSDLAFSTVRIRDLYMLWEHERFRNLAPSTTLNLETFVPFIGDASPCSLF